MAKISRRTITADDAVSEIKEHMLTLKFVLCSDEELDTAELAKMLQYVLRDWQDGRRSFAAEMLGVGLSRCLSRALLDTIEKEAQEEFGREVVPSAHGKGETSKWYVEASKRFAEQKKPWINPEPEVEIT